MIVYSPHKPCPSCTAAKDKQKSVLKLSGHIKSKVSNKRMFINIGRVKNLRSSSEKLTHPTWLIKVDERTGTKFSTFHAKKDDIVESVCEQFRNWDLAGLTG